MKLLNRWSICAGLLLVAMGLKEFAIPLFVITSGYISTLLLMDIFRKEDK